MFGMSTADALWWVNQVRLVGMWMAGIAGVIALVSGHLQLTLSDKVSKEKAESYERDKSALGERIAVAEKDTAKANAEAESLKLDALNLSLKLEQERIKRLQLEKAVAWRQLTPEQESVIINGLRGLKIEKSSKQFHDCIFVVTFRDDPEAYEFADQIRQAILKSGLGSAIHTSLQAGVGIYVDTDPEDAHRQVMTTLAKAGLSPQDSSERSGLFNIYVGKKPRPE